jgi:AcrR family transcriptional regulator
MPGRAAGGYNGRVSSSEQGASWTPEPLPRGRHKIPREEVRASQRDRLLRAMAEIVSAEGYEAATVPKVVAAARVSTNAFYELFPDKTACFIALCDHGSEDLFAEMVRFADEPDWLTSLDRGLDMYLRWWRDRAALTRAYLVELPAAGRRAIEFRASQQERFAAVTRYLADWARRDDPSLPPISEVALAVAVDAPTEVVSREVRAGRLAEILAIRDDLRFLLVKLLADDETATRTHPGLRSDAP